MESNNNSGKANIFVKVKGITQLAMSDTGKGNLKTKTCATSRHG